MFRLTGIVSVVCIICGFVATSARAQISPEEAYRRLRERQAQEQRDQGPKPKSTNSSKSSDSDDAGGTGIMPLKPSQGGDSASSSGSRQKFSEYRDAVRGFKIKYPAGWDVHPTEGKANAHDDKDYVTFTAHEPDDDSLVLDRIDVGHIPLYEHSDLDGTAKRYREAFERGPNAPVTFISESNITFAGEPGREIIMLGKEAHRTGPLKGLIVVGIARGQAYTMKMGTDPNRFDRMAKVFDAMVASFELIKPALPVPPMTEIVDKAHGFKIKLPKDWTKATTADAKMILAYTSQGVQSDPPIPPVNVNIVFSSRIPPAKDRLDTVLDGITDQRQKALEIQLPDVKWINESNIAPNGLHARKLIYTTKRAGDELQIAQIIGLAPTGNQYTITFTTTPQDYDKLSLIIDAIIDSFWVEKV